MTGEWTEKDNGEACVRSKWMMQCWWDKVLHLLQQAKNVCCSLTSNQVFLLNLFDLEFLHIPEMWMTSDDWEAQREAVLSVSILLKTICTKLFLALWGCYKSCAVRIGWCAKSRWPTHREQRTYVPKHTVSPQDLSISFGTFFPP